MWAQYCAQWKPLSLGRALMVDKKPGYAGDVVPDEAWAMLEADPKAQLVDVRTTAEWNFVGRPDLASLGRETCLIEWQSYPSMAQNPQFVPATAEAVAQEGASRETPVFFLCRSGARSRAAAIAMTAAGFTQAYNIAGGFEGDLDAERHRGTRNGWKAAGLPWTQS
jgi:rhodanese-related sulfurtransferase